MQQGVPLGPARQAGSHLMDGWETVSDEPAIQVGLANWAGSLKSCVSLSGGVAMSVHYPLAGPKGSQLPPPQLPLAYCHNWRMCTTNSHALTSALSRLALRTCVQVLLGWPLLREPLLLELHADEAAGGFSRHHLLSALRQAYCAAAAEEQEQREQQQQGQQQLVSGAAIEPSDARQATLVCLRRMQEGCLVPIIVS